MSVNDHFLAVAKRHLEVELMSPDAIVEESVLRRTGDGWLILPIGKGRVTIRESEFEDIVSRYLQSHEYQNMRHRQKNAHLKMFKHVNDMSDEMLYLLNRLDHYYQGWLINYPEGLSRDQAIDDACRYTPYQIATLIAENAPIFLFVNTHCEGALHECFDQALRGLCRYYLVSK